MLIIRLLLNVFSVCVSCIVRVCVGIDGLVGSRVNVCGVLGWFFLCMCGCNCVMVLCVICSSRFGWWYSSVLNVLWFSCSSLLLCRVCIV